MSQYISGTFGDWIIIYGIFQPFRITSYNVCYTKLLRRLITQLCDLTRIKWVNSTFAFVLYTCGYKTTEAVAKADYTKLYEDILSQNKEKQLYKGNIGLNDVKLCVEEAKKLTIDITYSS